jgi:hypothetical protein
MTVQLNTYSDISTIVNPILEQSLAVARDNNVMAGLVSPFSADGSEPRKFYEYSASTYKTLGESDDMTSSAFTPSALGTITPQEYGNQFFLTDQRIATDWNAVRTDAASELGAAMGQHIDVALAGLFNTFTGGSVSHTGSLVTWAYFFEMQSKLRANLAPMPYTFVCSPAQWFSLGSAASVGATVTNSPNIQNEFGRNFYVGSVAGVEIYVSANVETASTDAYAGMFSKQAIALDIRRAFRIEPERDASRRGIELNATMLYGIGLWRPTFGIYGLFKDAYS